MFGKVAFLLLLLLENAKVFSSLLSNIMNIATAKKMYKNCCTDLDSITSHHMFIQCLFIIIIIIIRKKKFQHLTFKPNNKQQQQQTTAITISYEGISKNKKKPSWYPAENFFSIHPFHPSILSICVCIISTTSSYLCDTFFFGLSVFCQGKN